MGRSPASSSRRVRGFVTATLGVLALVFIFSAAHGATYYTNALSGNDRNDGLSPATAWRSSRKTNLEDETVVPGWRERAVKALHEKPQVLQGAPVPDIGDSPQVERIVLGAEHVTGWTAFSTDTWKAPLQLSSAGGRLSVRSDDEHLTRSCWPDFLKEGDWFYDGDFLYLADSHGNPDSTGKTITADVWDEMELLETVEVNGWIHSPPTVFFSSIDTEPIHVLLDENFHDGWWWGPASCQSTETGSPQTWYLRDPDGNPDDTGKKAYAITKTGGWSVTSGDFNGDGLRDVVHSNHLGEVFINFGMENYASVPGQVLRDPQGLGFDVASAGDVNGDGFEDLLVTTYYGANTVYLHMGSQAAFNGAPTVVLRQPEDLPESYYFGTNAIPSTPGDFNGDGYSDTAILAYPADSLASPRYVYLYHGSESGIPSSPDRRIAILDTSMGVDGIQIADLNGDGFDELIVPSILPSTPSGGNVELYIYSGSAGGLIAETPRKLLLSVPRGEYGVDGKLAFTDLNGDGYPDLIFGNELADGVFVMEGSACIFYGSANGFQESPHVILSNPRPGENVRFGATLAGTGDFNHDGYNDLAVGCPYGNMREVPLPTDPELFPIDTHAATIDKGFVALYLGSPTGISDQPSLLLEGEDCSGWSLAHVGDIKGNGQNFIMLGEEFGASFLFALKGPTGALTVTIDSQEAMDAGAQWRVDGGSWRNGGVTVFLLPAGEHLVEFKDLKGWAKPENVTVTAVEGQIVTATGSYVRLYSNGLVDFNGDGRSDILWRHMNGDFYLWQMDGLAAKSVAYIPPIDTKWQVTALADFNGDGMTDILWRHADGTLYIWMMNGASTIGFGSPGTVDPSWLVAGASDFGGDGKADILWRHARGDLCLHEMNGSTVLKAGYLPAVDLSWRVSALADFDGDGRGDILWRHASGMLYLWLMNGATATGVGSPGMVDPKWMLAAAADLTGDGRADILWRHISGAAAIWQMEGATPTKRGMLGLVDPSWGFADAHDFNGDGKADILWRHSGGAVSLWLMSGFTAVGGRQLEAVDPNWHIENR